MTATVFTVLLVDDEPAVGMALAILLRREGFDVRFADSIEECLDRVEEDRPDVILCDACLGYESAHDLIRRLPAEHPIPVLVMSGDGNERWSGAAGILPKPFPPREFSRAVRSAIGVGDCAPE